MRKRNAIKSSFIGVVSKIITMILALLCSRVFMHELGIEVKGLHGILTNWLSLLQLTELGVGTAIVYALYQPLIDKNYKEIIQLMNIFKKMYCLIGIFILILGIGMSFFLKEIVGETTLSWEYIRNAYLIYLLTVAGSYFVSYKRNLLYADQKMYINTLIDTGFHIFASILKIYVIIRFQSYCAFLVIQFLQTIFSNVCISIWCDKNYTFLKEKVDEPYDKIPELKKNIGNIIAGKISGFIYGSTDNLIITKFVGMAAVGYMSSYYEITNILKGLSSSITEPIQPIIGNYIRDNKNKDDVYQVFLAYSFIRFCIADLLAIGLIIMVNPLITIWLGTDYLLPQIIPVLMAMDMYIAIVHGPTGEFISVLGLFKSDRNLSIVGMTINLVASIALVSKMGIAGVLIGTVLAQLFYWIARGFIVFKYYFEHGKLKYILNMLLYLGVVLVQCLILSYISNDVFIAGNIGRFILLGSILVVFYIVSVLACFFWTKEFKYLKILLRLRQ